MLTQWVIGIIFGCLVLISIGYLLRRQIIKCRRAEIILRQQGEREKLVNQIAQKIRQSLNLEEVLATTVTEVRAFLQADRVLIYRIWGDGTGTAMTETVLPLYPAILGQTFPEEVFPQEHHQLYIQGKTRVITNINQENIELCLIEFVKQFDVKAKLVVPIIQDIREVPDDEEKKSYLWGLLIAHQCRQPRQWQPEEIELMKQLATQVAIAIQQSELYEQLQGLNRELEERVQQRTEELAKTNDFLRAEIVERQRTEEALRRSEECFRRVVENALDIITILDQDGTIYYESPSVETVLGYSPTELIGGNFFKYIHPDDLTQIRSGIISATKTPPVVEPIEFRCQHKDQSWRTLEAISQKFLDDVPEPRIIVNSRDITERKRLHEVKLALEQEKELSSLKIRFFSMASHEFRTPLSTVLAAAQLLENSAYAGDNSEKWLRNLRRIQDSVKNMVQLLDDILTINRAETGKLEFNPKFLDLEKFCRQLLEEMQLSTSNQYHLSFVCQGENYPTYLDEKLLRSILSNLLGNAIKYSPKGGKICFSLGSQRDQIELNIKDSGIGISQEDQKQLFEPFYRGKNVRSIPGTGLGLVVVKKCVDLHGGQLIIESEMGKGTQVTVLLPLKHLGDNLET